AISVATGESAATVCADVVAFDCVSAKSGEEDACAVEMIDRKTAHGACLGGDGQTVCARSGIASVQLYERSVGEAGLGGGVNRHGVEYLRQWRCWTDDVGTGARNVEGDGVRTGVRICIKDCLTQ